MPQNCLVRTAPVVTGTTRALQLSTWFGGQAFSDALFPVAACLTLHCTPLGLRSMLGSWPQLLLWQGLPQRRAMWWHPAPWLARQTKRICMKSSR